MMPRLKEKYLKEIVPNMMKEFSYKNIMEVPKFRRSSLMWDLERRFRI